MPRFVTKDNVKKIKEILEKAPLNANEKYLVEHLGVYMDGIVSQPISPTKEPLNIAVKYPGDLIESSEWNDAISEIKRLENDKLSKTGGTGPLTIDGNVGIGTDQPKSRLHIKASDADCALIIEDIQSKGHIILDSLGDNSLVVSGPGDEEFEALFTFFWKGKSGRKYVAHLTGEIIS